MFDQKVFYHEHVRKAIIAFGTLFNNIEIRRKNTDGTVAQSLRVPLSYTPKQKTIQRITEVGDLEEGRAKYEITLPRMGFEITSLTYDSSRKLMPTQTVRAIDSTNGVKVSFISTPYNMGISMSIFAKNQEDGLQILEQILPYFNPDFNITIFEIPELGVKRDLQFILDSVTYNDDYAGSYDQRVTITWDLNFTIKMNFFGYVQDADLIKKTIANIYATYNIPANADPDTAIGTRITTTPDPLDADPSAPYGFMQEFDDIFLG